MIFFKKKQPDIRAEIKSLCERIEKDTSLWKTTVGSERVFLCPKGKLLPRIYNNMIAVDEGLYLYLNGDEQLAIYELKKELATQKLQDFLKNE